MNEIRIGNFSAKILKHSRTVLGHEAITFLVTYERFIHAEVMTHRWSRNYSSSRAIPYAVMRKWTDADPALPLHFGKNQGGMQSGLIVDSPDNLRLSILEMYDETKDWADGVTGEHSPHKEIINRYLEPWGWITGVITTGKPQLMNFFNLRCSEFAHPNIQRLAVSMARLCRDSTLQELQQDDWHVPFFDDYIPKGRIHDSNVSRALIWSVARSAWCSYNAPEKEADFARAKVRHDDCVKFKHVSPMEHQLRARDDHDRVGLVPGYDSYRMCVPGESAGTFDFSILDTKYKERDFILPEAK